VSWNKRAAKRSDGQGKGAAPAAALFMHAYKQHAERQREGSLRKP